MRLENGFATLSELAAASEGRTEMIVTLLRRMDERMDQHLTWINQLGAAQANAETKLAALTDAQINTEAKLMALTNAQVNTEAKLMALTNAQVNTEAKLVALTNAQINTEAKLAALTDAQIRTEQSLAAFQANTERALAKLTENIAGLLAAQARTDRRVDALIDVAGEKPDGGQG